jgi:hypothetical protein
MGSAWERFAKPDDSDVVIGKLAMHACYFDLLHVARHTLLRGFWTALCGSG